MIFVDALRRLRRRGGSLEFSLGRSGLSRLSSSGASFLSSRGKKGSIVVALSFSGILLSDCFFLIRIFE